MLLRTWIFLFAFLPLAASAQFAVTAFHRHRTPMLGFTTSAQTIESSNCSGVVTVQARDSRGVASNVASNLTVNLAASGSLTFYSDANCLDSITSVVILSGQSSANFYFLDTSAGTRTLTATATNYQAANQSETISASSFVWTGAGGNANWSTGANWSGGVAPGNANLAIFNSTCVSNCSPVIAADIDVGGIRMESGYTGTITQNSGVAITLHNKNWYQAGGTFQGTSGSTANDKITVWGVWNVLGGTFTAPRGNIYLSAWANTIKFSDSATFNHNSGLITIDNCANPTFTPGNTTFNNITLVNNCNWTGSTLVGTLKVAGNLTIELSNYQGGFGGGGTIVVSGNVISNSQGWGIASNCVLRMAGGIGSNVTLSGTSGGSFGSMEIASLGTINASGTIGLTGNFTYTSGTVNMGTSLFSFSGSSTVSTGSLNFYDVTIGLGAYQSMTISGTVSVGHNLKLSTWDGRSGISGGLIDVKGDVTSDSAVNYGSVPITYSGTSNQTVTATAGSVFYSGNVTVNKASGTLVLASDVAWDGSSQTLNVVNGPINLAGHALTLKALTLNGNTITRNGGTLTVNGVAVGAGTQSVYGGTVAP